MKIKMSSNISKYKPKFISNFTLRQTISLVVCLAINVPTYLLIKTYINEELASWLILILGVPILCFGWAEFQGLPFEKFIGEFILSNFIAPKIRPFKIEDELEEFIKEEKNSEFISEKK